MKKLIPSLSHRRADLTLPWAPILLAALLSALVACQSKPSRTAEFPDFKPDKDYSPEKVCVDHAIGFDISYHGHYKLLHLFRHYNDKVDTLSYVLVQKNTPVPAKHKGTPVITLPVENIVSISTTHLGMFEMLESLDHLKGVESKQYISSEKIRSKVETGKIIEVAPAGALNVETTIAAGTDLLMGVGYPNSQNDSYQQLERAGIPTLLNADWQEKDLLGRAEWVKLLAALLNKEKLVNEKFAAIEQSYRAVLEKVNSEVKKAPLTITGIAQGDAWHVVGGKSFAWHVLNLAKVDYPWKDNDLTGSLKLDFETVYKAGLEADYWMTPSNAKSLKEILARDSRYADFKSFKTGNVFNIYGRYTEGGGNDYYESAVVNPHIVLKDVVKIFHPEIFPDHQLVYFKRLQ